MVSNRRLNPVGLSILASCSTRAPATIFAEKFSYRLPSHAATTAFNLILLLAAFPCLCKLNILDFRNRTYRELPSRPLDLSHNCREPHDLNPQISEVEPDLRPR